MAAIFCPVKLKKKIKNYFYNFFIKLHEFKYQKAEWPIFQSLTLAFLMILTRSYMLKITSTWIKKKICSWIIRNSYTQLQCDKYNYYILSFSLTLIKLFLKFFF